MEIKTNAMRILDKLKIEYNVKKVDIESAVSGEELAILMNEIPERVFKTLVTVSKSNKYYVFIIPSNKELDLKKCAVSVGEKSVEMLKSRFLFELTGYVHGGCSPIGMKKQFVTRIDNSAKNFEKIIFSGGKIGVQLEMSVSNLKNVINIELAELTN